MTRTGPSAKPSVAVTTPRRFPEGLMYAAATLYYLEDANQAEIAERLGTSRATVSRLLSEARRYGIVRIEVVPPMVVDNEALSERTAEGLGLDAVYLAPSSAGTPLGTRALAPALFAALQAVELRAGDVLLVSSGRTVYEVAQADLPALPGVVLAPMIGGQDEPEAWYQPNEIARQFAAKVGGHPSFLYAPALPGPALHKTLLKEPSIERILELWRSARCAVLGIGAPPLTRESIPGFVPTDAVSLREAVGDVCSRFYDRNGAPVPFPGSDRLMSTGFEVLRGIPVTIGLAVGAEKVVSIAAGARAGYFNRLVTDAATATALIAQVEMSEQRGHGGARPGMRSPRRASDDPVQVGG